MTKSYTRRIFHWLNAQSRYVMPSTNLTFLNHTWLPRTSSLANSPTMFHNIRTNLPHEGIPDGLIQVVPSNIATIAVHSKQSLISTDHLATFKWPHSKNRIFLRSVSSKWWINQKNFGVVYFDANLHENLECLWYACYGWLTITYPEVTSTLLTHETLERKPTSLQPVYRCCNSVWLVR